ncbi:MAG: patatin-like phospholipase family protein [Pseudomonadota bacterium]|nr:patatin-like phospholipase family protein [Pseudomonadota bacterium]
MRKWTGKRVGLALGGGGVRGFSHIGVLKVLEQEDIRIDLIAGTSAGALIGGAYAGGLSPREIHRRVETYLQSPAFKNSALQTLGSTFNPRKRNALERASHLLRTRYLMARSLFQPAILPSEEFQSLIDYFIADIAIEETRIPFLAVTTDLISGERVVFREGSLRQAVLASCAVPGAVAPIRQGEWLLADGGITSLVPVHAAKQADVDVVIAVAVSRDVREAPVFETAQEISQRAGEIAADKLEAIELKDADVIIRPEVGDLHWMDFSRSRDLIHAGEAAARASLARIHQALPLPHRLVRLTRRFSLFGRKAAGSGHGAPGEKETEEMKG